ncbi:MAG: 2-C-methyl-D-erythritol 4-phosphate cytidylyltransferase [Fusobacteriaceae bacterium]|nr:2-C-methyl-D-erythritol 4-phosphate cytidylyltransferase [Fusobacteriaceae bacterium]
MHSSDFKIKNIFIVAAAGFGKRLNLGYPKQFLEYNEKPLFIYPVLIAQFSDKIDKIIIVGGEDSIDKIKYICDCYNITKLHKIVVGGKERQHSVYNAINEINNIKNLDNNPIIFVQDGVRIFFKEKYIDESLKELENNNEIDGVLIGVPVKDTIKIIDDRGFILDTPERKTLISANTPQVFKYKILKDAYDYSYKNNFMSTDDSSLVEKIGGKIKVIIGDYDNIKITTIEDLRYIK